MNGSLCPSDIGYPLAPASIRKDVNRLAAPAACPGQRTSRAYLIEILLFSLGIGLTLPAFAQPASDGTERAGTTTAEASTQQKSSQVPPGESGGSVSPPSPARSESFEGVIIHADPLEVKTMTGEVRQFLPHEQKMPPSRLKPGDLVRLTYSPGPGGNVLAEPPEVIGATITGTIKEIADDMSWLIVRTRQPGYPENEINVPLQAAAQFQPLVSAMRRGDGVRAIYVRDGGMNTLNGINHVKSLEWQSKPVERAKRWASLIGAAGILFIIAWVFTGGHPTHLFLGKDNRYSSSQFQTVLWFGLVVSAYIAIVSHRIVAAGWSYVGGVDIPPNLLILSGISVLTFTAAKALTTRQVEDKPDLKAMAVAPRAADLISTDDNRTDLGDFQMVAITILATVIYAISTVEFMEQIEFRRVVTMPDVDATMLSIFGLGQAAYLGKKAAGKDRS